IASYEMAYRLQTSAPDLMNLKSESKETLEMYGCDPDKPSFARACLLARRMIERGVRFVNIYHEGWDAHSDIPGNLKTNYGATDDLGFRVAENEVHVHDLQATILHCLGFDHERLTYEYQGRKFRLTDVHGHVVKDILA